MPKATRGLLLVCAILSSLAISCNQNPAEVKSEDQIPNVADLPTPTSRPDAVTSHDSTETGPGGELLLCHETTYDIARAFNDYPQFDPNAEVIWPGNVLQGGSLASATPEPIPTVLERGPGNIVINNVTGAEISSCAVDPTTYAAVQTCANRIIRSQPESFPARGSINVSRAKVRRELAVDINASAGFLETCSKPVVASRSTSATTFRGSS